MICRLWNNKSIPREFFCAGLTLQEFEIEHVHTVDQSMEDSTRTYQLKLRPEFVQNIASSLRARS